MREQGGGEPIVIGRPSIGGLMKDAYRLDAWRREKGRDIRPLRRLIPYVLSHWPDATLGLVFILISSATPLALTYGAKVTIDHGFQSRAALEATFETLAAGAALFALSTGLRIYFVRKLGERVVADLRKAVFAHVMKLDQTHFLKVRTGEVLSRLTTDMTMVEGSVGNVAPVGLRSLLTLVGAIVMLVAFSPNFTVLVLVLIPLLITPLLLLGRRMQRLSVLAQDRFAEAVGYASEGLEALDNVQAFGQEDAVSRRFDGAIEGAFIASRAQLRTRGGMSALMIALIFAGMLTLLFECALAVLHRTMTGGTLLQLLALAMLAANAVKDISEFWGEVQKASGAAQRVMGMLDIEPGIAAPDNPTRLPVPARGEVFFDDVRFAYPGRPERALKGLTLHVRPGERVALVGPSGAGKSTVLRLLLRFYDPDAGAVCIDGVDLRQADPKEVRARLALVAQETPLFSGSAADNIRFGRADATDDEVRAAALAAQAEGFLTALPQGFETPMGERAKTLSGGQRQRLAIARALIRRSPILLLDEATSALDAENERLVQKALHEAMEGRTTLVIAHRLATVLEADRIVVMDEGRVVDEGRHAELMARGGLYARLAKLQFGAEAA